MTTLTQNPILCKVFYDRSAREYIVRNGTEIARFPQGQANKVLAQWAAINHDDSAVEAVARDLVAQGHDEGRVIRAARIVIEGTITSRTTDGDYTRAIVAASDGNRSPITGQPFYHVHHNLKWQCDCCDYERGRDDNPQYRCKHTLAVEMANRLEADRQAVAERKAADKLEMAKRRRSTALPASVDRRDSLDDWLGYDDSAARDRAYAAALRPDRANLRTNFNRNLNTRRW